MYDEIRRKGSKSIFDIKSLVFCTVFNYSGDFKLYKIFGNRQKVLLLIYRKLL